MSIMSRKQLEAALNKFLKNFHFIEKTYEQLRMVTECSPESNAVTAMFLFVSEYMELLSKMVDDQHNWIEWFVWDNECGKRAMEAKTGAWKKKEKITSTKQLARLMLNEK